MTFLKLAFISIFENELTKIFKIKDKAKNQKRYRYFFVWVYAYLIKGKWEYEVAPHLGTNARKRHVRGHFRVQSNAVLGSKSYAVTAEVCLNWLCYTVLGPILV